MNVLIKGGAGFIGLQIIKHFLTDSRYHVYNLDKLTYASNIDSLAGLESYKYTFIQGDITDSAFVETLFENQTFKHVIHLAAESQVDRSIEDPFVFAKTIDWYVTNDVWIETILNGSNRKNDSFKIK